MKILKEFKEFAIKGNMIEMAVGIVIGASFNSVVDVLVKNILLPPLSLLSNGVNFQQKKIVLREGTPDLSQVSIDYGFFINTVVDFLVVGFTIFIVIKFFNSLKRKSEDVNEPSIQTPKEILLLTQIKDLLEHINQKDNQSRDK
jgi:large conductance mechanosensitive channel